MVSLATTNPPRKVLPTKSTEYMTLQPNVCYRALRSVCILAHLAESPGPMIRRCGQERCGHLLADADHGCARPWCHRAATRRRSQRLERQWGDSRASASVCPNLRTRCFVSDDELMKKKNGSIYRVPVSVRRSPTTASIVVTVWSQTRRKRYRRATSFPVAAERPIPSSI